ncbi:MAG TPA: hypothetical protein VJ521_00555, partial [Acidobacteriota bacterium]|nr:hypothetical protein [Acidobacteriota bacterium]
MRTGVFRVPTGPLLSIKSRHLRSAEDVLRDDFHLILPEWILAKFGSSSSSRHSQFFDLDDYPWRPIWPSASDSSSYHYYFEVANRLAYLQRLSFSCGNSFARVNINRIIDRYLPLAIAMQSTGHYVSKGFRESFQSVWPDPFIVSDSDSLPNICFHMLYSFHRDPDSSPFSHECDRSMVEILNKAEPSACRFRGYDTIVKKMLSCASSAPIRDVLRRVILASFLGSYSNSCVQACFP